MELNSGDRRKKLILRIPYLIFGLVCTNFGEACRLAEGADASEKAASLMTTLGMAFENPLPSVHPLDLLIGLCCACMFRFAVYMRGKNAKKYRHNTEYGSARWGTHQDIAPFEEAAKVMLGFIAKIKAELGYEVLGLNLGGGFGIMYTENDDPIEYDEYIKSVSEVVKREAERNGLDVPFMLMEPGRSIAAPAGITLYTIGNIKDIKGVRKYVSVDGGMGDNPRYIMYQAGYTVVVANKAGDPATDTVTIAGKCCESGDLICKDLHVTGNIEAGDIFAVFSTGAYNYTMSSNYNQLPKPAVVFTYKGKSKVVIRRQTFDDLVEYDEDQAYE